MWNARLEQEAERMREQARLEREAAHEREHARTHIRPRAKQRNISRTQVRECSPPQPRHCLCGTCQTCRHRENQRRSRTGEPEERRIIERYERLYGASERDYYRPVRSLEALSCRILEAAAPPCTWSDRWGILEVAR